MRTIGRMSQYALHPDEAAAAASRHYLEYPQVPAAAAAAAAPLQLHLSDAAAPARAARGAGWRAIGRGAAPALVARAAGADEQLLASPEREARRAARRAAGAGLWWLLPGQEHPVYGSSDPLSEDEIKGLPVAELVQVGGGAELPLIRCRCLLMLWRAEGVGVGGLAVTNELVRQPSKILIKTMAPLLTIRPTRRDRTTGSAAPWTAAPPWSAMSRGRRRRACRGGGWPPRSGRGGCSAG
jgi:hypothetical protein